MKDKQLRERLGFYETDLGSLFLEESKGFLPDTWEQIRKTNEAIRELRREFALLLAHQKLEISSGKRIQKATKSQSQGILAY